MRLARAPRRWRWPAAPAASGRPSPTGALRALAGAGRAGAPALDLDPSDPARVRAPRARGGRPVAGRRRAGRGRPRAGPRAGRDGPAGRARGLRRRAGRRGAGRRRGRVDRPGPVGAGRTASPGPPAAGRRLPRGQAVAAGLLAERAVEFAGSRRPDDLWDAARSLRAETFLGPFAVDEEGRQTAHSPLIVVWRGRGAGLRREVVWRPGGPGLRDWGVSGPPRERAQEDVSRLVDWFRREGADLPWRRTRDRYRVLVAEAQLQATPVARVVPYYLSFVERWPTAGRPGGRAPGRRPGRLARPRVPAPGQEPARRGAGRRRRAAGPSRSGSPTCPASVPTPRPPCAASPTARTSCRSTPTRPAWSPAASPTAGRARPAGGWEAGQAVMDLGRLWCTARAPRCGAGCPMRRRLPGRRRRDGRRGHAAPAPPGPLRGVDAPAAGPAAARARVGGAGQRRRRPRGGGEPGGRRPGRAARRRAASPPARRRDEGLRPGRRRRRHRARRADPREPARPGRGPARTLGVPRRQAGGRRERRGGARA